MVPNAVPEPVFARLSPVMLLDVVPTVAAFAVMPPPPACA
jgi:hypothetical protein